MNVAIQILRAVHIPLGVLGLLLFALPLIFKKGGTAHRRIGWAFVVCMCIAAVTAGALGVLRGIQAAHEPTGATLRQLAFPIFIVNVALLTLASVTDGIAVLRQKGRSAPHRRSAEWILPIFTLIFSVFTIGVGVMTSNPVLFTLPTVAIIVNVQTLYVLATAPTDRMFWWYRHMSGMFGGCIAALTAALVQNTGVVVRTTGLPQWSLWIGPVALGLPLLYVWIAVYKRKFRRTATPR